ncbi:hypothetical protein QR680_018281 [Steinernema hermaphroditum]|uniref:Uncharacterized protein n=1 Tax=Steinernema hermaphroditum TaxID=289476 RepID=A0AA39HJU0_9BILA|nr:hypothetical protein QR680_018281 [Steinernema hermaphroditum]
MIDGSVKSIFKVMTHGFGLQEIVQTNDDHSKWLVELPSISGYSPQWVYTLGNFEGFHIDHEGKEQTIPEDYGKPVFQQICTGCNKKSHCSKQFNNYDKMVEDVREKRLQRKKGKIKKNTRKKKTHKGAKR